MINLGLIRKIASLLLLLCFVLPLSKCESKMHTQPEAQSQTANSPSKQNESASEAVKGNSEATVKVDFLYAYVLLRDGWEDVQKNKTMASSLTMLAVLAVFFLPCALLALKEKPQAIITLLASVPAGFALFMWVLVWGTPQAGGVLAIICWISLLLVSLVYSLRLALHSWRQRKARA